MSQKWQWENLPKILLRAKIIPMRDYHNSDAIFFSFLSSEIRISECRPGGPSETDFGSGDLLEQKALYFLG